MKSNKRYSRYYGSPKRSKKPSHASSILAAALPNIAIGPRLNEYTIKRDWPEIVGKAIAARAVPARLIKNTLFCEVSSSAWMTELNFQKPLIIEKINKIIGSGTIKGIIFKPGVLPEDTSPEAPVEAPFECSMTNDFIEKTTSNISDDSLKNLVKRVMKKYPF